MTQEQDNELLRELLRELLQVIAKHTQRAKPLENVSVNSPSRSIGETLTIATDEGRIFMLAKIESEIGTLIQPLKDAIPEQHAILYTGTKGRVVYLPHGIASNDLRVKIEIPGGRKA